MQVSRTIPKQLSPQDALYKHTSQRTRGATPPPPPISMYIRDADNSHAVFVGDTIVSWTKTTRDTCVMSCHGHLACYATRQCENGHNELYGVLRCTCKSYTENLIFTPTRNKFHNKRTPMHLLPSGNSAQVVP